MYIRRYFYEFNNIMRSQIVTTSDTKNRRRKTLLAYAFTEEGIYMLSTILPTNKTIHDRLVLIDNETLYFCGPSSKDAGNKIGTIVTLPNIDKYLKLIKGL